MTARSARVRTGVSTPLPPDYGVLPGLLLLVVLLAILAGILVRVAFGGRHATSRR